MIMFACFGFGAIVGVILTLWCCLIWEYEPDGPAEHDCDDWESKEFEVFLAEEDK